MSANGHIDLKPRIQMITQHFLDLAFSTQSRCGIIGEHYRHQLSMARAALRFGRDQDVIANARIVREQKANAALFHVAPDHFGMRPGEHFNNLPFSPTTAIQTCDGDQYLITIKHLIHLTSREKQILCVPLERSRKTITISVAHHPAAQQIHALRHTIGTPPTGDNLTVTLHRAQTFTQCVKIALATQTQRFGNTGERHGGIRRLEQAQDHFPAGNGVLVAALLPRRMGVNGRTRGFIFAAWRQDEIRWLDSAGWEEDAIIRGNRPPDGGP